MTGISQFEVKVAPPGGRDLVSTFFERTVYGTRALGSDLLVLEPPDHLDCRVVRREVEVYFRMIERRHPGVSVSFAD